MLRVWRDLWRSSRPIPHSRAGSPRADHIGKLPGLFWRAPVEIQQPLWVQGQKGAAFPVDNPEVLSCYFGGECNCIYIISMGIKRKGLGFTVSLSSGNFSCLDAHCHYISKERKFLEPNLPFSADPFITPQFFGFKMSSVYSCYFCFGLIKITYKELIRKLNGIS